MPVSIASLCARHANDAGRLMDILYDVQNDFCCIDESAVDEIARAVGISRADVVQTVSFYHFFSQQPRGRYTVYLNNSAVAFMKGRKEVADAFEREVGCRFGEVTADGLIGLFSTADIGMNDQEPAALINGEVFTELTPGKVKTLVAGMRAGKPLKDMIALFGYGDGANASEAIRSMVKNNIRKKGKVIFGEYEAGAAIKKCVAMQPSEVIQIIKTSSLRGRGGAGFPTGLKWEFTAKAKGKRRWIICNADEGEPGTFKDRVILTECSRMVFDGMVAAGYSIGAAGGVMYLRGEYHYLKNHLERVLDAMRAQGMLGENIAGRKGFSFDIRIQMGAGAYVCGEESALIESAEGRRGEPRNRPPFPAERGFLYEPTAVNNVETFAAAAQIIDKGAEWFRAMGTDQSAGTKVLSISGDCASPGVYEVEWGLTVADALVMAGAAPETTLAVQVGGPSGTCVGGRDFGKKIGFEDLATGGSVISIGKGRNLLEIVHNFMEFFTDESCGSCVPCRAGTWILRNKIRRIMEGAGTESDLKVMCELGAVMKTLNKCGLGQTAANPVVTTINNLKEEYLKVIHPDGDFDPGFDLAAAVARSCAYVGRKPAAAHTGNA